MFDLFRSRGKAVRYLLGAILGLVALSLVVTLIPGYGAASAPREQVVAEIGGDPLTVREVQQTLQNVTRERRVPQEMLQFYLPQVVDQMITERAIAYQAKRMGFRITDDEVANAIRSMLMQYFPNGDIPQEAYRRFLQQQGLDVQQFEKTVRQNLLMLRLQNVALEGAIVTPDEVEREYHRKNDKLKIEYVKFSPPANLRSQVTVSTEEVKAWFDGNKSQFTIAEKRSMSVLIADEAKIGADIEVPEPQLRAAYNSQLDRFRTQDRVHVRHILIKTQGKPAGDVPKLEAKANDLLKQIKAGADFAKLARENSEDPGSGTRGGDLDWITKGQTVPNFETAAFSLKPNEISNVVKTEYGFHILQVLEKEQARVKPFEEVRDELAKQLRRETVTTRMQQSVEQARGELAKNPQNAAQIASKYGLTYYKVEKAARGESVPELGSSPELDTAVAGLRKNEVSQVFQIGANKLGIALVSELFPQRPAEFAEVEDQVRERLINEKTSRLADQRAKEVTDKLKAAAKEGKDLREVAKQLGLELKTADYFTSEGAIEGVGQASLVAEGFLKPVGTVIGPFNTGGGDVFLARTVDKQVASPANLASQREEIVLGLKRKRAGERKELFEDGLLAQLIKEGKVRKYDETINRILQSYRG